MAFGVSAFGINPYLPQSLIPPRRNYNKIEFFGDITIDDVHLLDFEYTRAQVEALDIAVEPTWDDNTLMLAHYNNNLGAGNLENINGTIDTIEVFRKERADSVFTKIATLNGSAEEYIDISAIPFKNYTYEMVASNNIERSEPVVGQEINIDVYNDILIDSTNRDFYVFNLNLTENETSSNTGYSRYETINKFPAFLRGRQQYATLGARAIPIANEATLCSDTEISQNIDFMNNLRNFIDNDNLKFIKTRKGFFYKGKTFDYKHSPLNIGIGQQPYYVKFNFVETEG